MIWYQNAKLPTASKFLLQLLTMSFHLPLFSPQPLIEQVFDTIPKRILNKTVNFVANKSGKDDL